MTSTPSLNSAPAANKTRNRVMTATAIDLLEATRTHLCQFEVPHPWSVTINTSLSGRAINVQLDCLEPPEVAAALLAWADTLTAVTAEAWRTPNGDSVHLSVTGHLANSALLRVFAAIPYTDHGLGADLDPGAEATLRLSALRQLATPGQVSA
ncbi:MAG: hypothetical protein JO287_27640 [Pseudonocardiales bacterium]|nr:hypothetical protein [Pseudonocardiales bacterium]